VREPEQALGPAASGVPIFGTTNLAIIGGVAARRLVGQKNVVARFRPGVRDRHGGTEAA